MNYLGIDYGTKNIGLALAVSSIISTLPSIKNDSNTTNNICQIITDLKIDKIYIGLSQGKVAKKILVFVAQLKTVIKLPIETVEESVSTIEATEIFKQNRHSRKQYKQQIDSVSAAVILNRVISSI